jgi:CubicO group peptidase (beta-lactamase class C family)/fucose 4-O-acetylase-like acetyltransferase
MPLDLSSAATPKEPRTESRNSFLDAVRAVAIVRVVLWHTFGYAWLSFLIASMPAMFFVAGSLMYRSLKHRSAISVQLQRFRRLLIPLWLFAAIAVGVMLIHQRDAAPASTIDPLDIVGWLFPISDPGGSEWGIAWWTHLWYLRCLTWLLLLTPLLFWSWRRVGPLLLALPIAGVVITETRIQAGADVPWQLQDLALYGLFWLVGFAYEDGLLKRIGTGGRICLCLTATAAAAAWMFFDRPPGNIVNASYPLHLFVGLAWLFGALACEGLIAALARGRRVEAVFYWINERALTIYLWHAAGLFLMYDLLWTEAHSEATRVLLALPIVTAATVVAVLAFGWIEDVAAGRPVRGWPGRGASGASPRKLLLLGTGAAVVAAGIGVWITATTVNLAPQEDGASVTASTHRIPPSGVGLRIRTQQAQILPAQPAPPLEETVAIVAQASEDTPPNITHAELDSEFESWAADWNIPGATVTWTRATGESWTASIGEYEDGTAFTPDEVYWTASLTKTFTSALVLRLVDWGILHLDEPVIAYLPDFPEADRFTVRNLLQHTSGLVPGDGPPDEALEEAAEAGLQFEPGSSTLYSRAAYYLLGLLIEDGFNKSYTQVLHDELLDPLGLASTFMDEELFPLPYATHSYVSEKYARVRQLEGSREVLVSRNDYLGSLWSSAGVWSTTGDLARWALMLWDGDQVIMPAVLDEMTNFLGPEFDLAGIATYPFCPCWMESERLRAERWGHLAANGVLEYDREDHAALAIHIAGTILDDDRLAALDDLSARLRSLLRGRQLIPPDAAPETELEEQDPVSDSTAQPPVNR